MYKNANNNALTFHPRLALSIVTSGISLLDFSIIDSTFCKTSFDVSFSAICYTIDPNTQRSAIQLYFALSIFHLILLFLIILYPEAYSGLQFLSFLNFFSWSSWNLLFNPRKFYIRRNNNKVDPIEICSSEVI